MRAGLAFFGPGRWLGAGMLALAWVPAAAPLAAQDIAPVGDPLAVALTTGPLLPEAVLRSSALTFPSILEAFEREAAARSDQLAADGAFDLMLRADAFDRITGFNDGGAVRAPARRCTRTPPPSRCRPSGAAASCAASSRSPPASSTAPGATSSPR
jgi:hypothetical protein